MADSLAAPAPHAAAASGAPRRTDPRWYQIGVLGSLLAWGLLSSVFEQKEYIDFRVLEGLAQEMIQNPRTRAAWEEALKDEAFAGNEFARYLWWYRRTPYWDETVGLMPVFRAMKAPALKTQPWQ